MNLTSQIANRLRKQTRRLFLPSPDFDNAETVHRMRVASRRLRAGLRFFGVRCPPELRRLGHVLGAVRALDVHRALLRDAPQRCPVLERRFAQERRRRVAELQRLYRAMNPVVWQQRPVDAHRVLERLRQTMEKRLRQFEKKESRAAFHRLRIAVKKYRYGLEIAGATKPVKPLKRLQELMGACHDVETLLKELPPGALREHFEKEHKRRWAAVRKLLDDRRHWVKKVKWDHD